VEVEGGQKLPCRLAVLADGVHSKTAAGFHKAKLEYMGAVAWRLVSALSPSTVGSQKQP
jgi:2-polyprenyl-6-methoxyphenol hydroxylase-like FAD-dependent oxidoreductase